MLIISFETKITNRERKQPICLTLNLKIGQFTVILKIKTLMMDFDARKFYVVQTGDCSLCGHHVLLNTQQPLPIFLSLHSIITQLLYFIYFKLILITSNKNVQLIKFIYYS